ncbi:MULTISPECIES: DUF2057 domain-containing protein [unclassified Pseudoalteromonas]|uniref:DUF2057 domain-containing protein n=1 Tax=unclassified Pseudoalteromonas TaxID=194690 RepID=UPI003014999A
MPFLRTWGMLLIALIPAAHAAQLNFPEEIIPLQVGEKTIEHSFFSKVREVQLEPGQYQVKMRYSDLYEVGYDDHEIIESEPFWATVTISQQGQYHIEFNRPNNVVAAKTFAEQPLIQLQAPDESLATSLVVSKTAPQMSNTQPTTSPATAAQLTTMASEPSQSMPAAPTAAHPDVVAMLQYWWQQATPAQRKAFLAAIKAQ